MRRKKRTGKSSQDRWLVSYADFITLLFAFFVVLFATGQSDRRKKVELAQSIQSAFNRMGVFEPHSQQTTSMRLDTGGALSFPGFDQHFFGVPGSMMLARLRLQQAALPEISQGVIVIHESAEGLVISLKEAGFFNSGAADVRGSALPVLDRMADVIPPCPLRVEGHTDNIPIHTPQFASNWELSSARASSIARRLLTHQTIHAENLSVAGYAEFHPTASNATAEGRARNRRVDIVLLADGC